MYAQITAEAGGATNALFNLINNLDKGQYTPVVLFAREGKYLDEFEKVGCKVFISKLGQITNTVHSPLKGNFRTLFMLGYFCFRLPFDIYTILKLIKREGIELVHINVSTLYSVAIAAKLAKVKVIWHVREVLNRNWVTKFQVFFINKFSTLILCVSSFVSESFTNKEKILVVYDGIDISNVKILNDENSIRKIANTKKEDIVILMFGIISGAFGKGFYDYLDAISIVGKTEKNLVFWVLGDSPIPGFFQKLRNTIFYLLRRNSETERIILEKKTKELKIKKLVRFLGYSKNVFDYINAADIVVIPPRFPEGFGLTLIEAGALGKPVIATNIGPTPEIITNNVSGILTEAGAPNALAKSIIRLVQNPLLGNTLGKTFYQKVLPKFNISITHYKINNIYAKIFSEH